VKVVSKGFLPGARRPKLTPVRFRPESLPIQVPGISDLGSTDVRT
jgi:hypothetical protein